MQGERLHARQQRELAPDRPAVDLRVGGSQHDRLERLHPLAVEAREQQPSVAQVLVAIEQEHRPPADDRAEERVRLAGVEAIVRALEQLLDERRVVDEHEAAVEQRAERDGAPIAAAAGLEVARAAEHEAGGLQQSRQLRAGGQAADGGLLVAFH